VEKECFKISVYGAENWTLRKVDQNCLEGFEMLCWRRMEKITWNDDVRSEVMLYREKNKGISYILYVNNRNAIWISYILCKNCLLKHAICRKDRRKK